MHVNFENNCVRPIWLINCWFQLLQMFLVVKRSRNKSAHSEPGVLSPPGHRCPGSPWRVTVAFLIVRRPLIRSFFIVAHSPLQSWETWSVFSPPCTQSPAVPTGGLVTQKVWADSLSIRLQARGQAFVWHSCLILPLHNWCQRETSRGNANSF